MGRVINALNWDGVYTTIGLYSAFPTEYSPKGIDFSYQGISPRKVVHPYLLEDEDNVLNGNILVLFEMQLNVVPDDLEGYLRQCLSKVAIEGAQFSWLAFDGSFDFEHIFTKDIADQIYGFQFGSESPMVVLSDEQLRSDDWLENIRSIRDRLFHS